MSKDAGGMVVVGRIEFGRWTEPPTTQHDRVPRCRNCRWWGEPAGLSDTALFKLCGHPKNRCVCSDEDSGHMYHVAALFGCIHFEAGGTGGDKQNAGGETKVRA